MSIRTIAILSPGNMGGGVGKFLGRNGYDVVTTLTGRSDFTRRKAVECGFRDAGSMDALVREADLVLSILPPAHAVAMAEETASAMKRTGATPPYADCNATSPRTALQMQRIVEGAGAAFIDVGIIGATPSEGRYPEFCASGPHVRLLDELDGKGVKIVHVGPEIGAGSAIKICNGAYNKGAFALYTAVMLAAEHYGFTEHLRNRLPGSQAGTVAKLDDAIVRLPSLAGRYIGEMEQVSETFESIGLPGGFHAASAALFRMLGGTSLARQRREEIDPDRTTPATLRILVDELERQDEAARRQAR
jgi:3-hydroxyisobutyrate dehydrogenase-like beta-hydroxyacid dehydrogenase